MMMHDECGSVQHDKLFDKPYLKEAFSKYGQIKGICIRIHKEDMNKSNKPSRLAFITFKDTSSVISLLNPDTITCTENSVIHVNRSFANEYSDSHLAQNIYIKGTDISVDSQKLKDFF